MGKKHKDDDLVGAQEPDAAEAADEQPFEEQPEGVVEEQPEEQPEPLVEERHTPTPEEVAAADRRMGMEKHDEVRDG